MTCIRRILVLCEGNHCRSPLAEALLRKALPEVEVVSAGINALIGHPAHREALQMAQAWGLDLSGHRGRPFLLELALRCDLILVMTRAQKEACEARVPTARGRIFLLAHWLPSGEQEIADPIGLDADAHERSYHHLQLAIQTWLSRLR